MKRFKYLAFPYKLWMGVLVGIPLLIMVVLSFLDLQGFNFRTAEFTWQNFVELRNPAYAVAFANSLAYAGVATLICLVLGYAVAYIISTSKIKNKYVLLFILILPMWTNMLLRVKALEMLSLPEGFMKNTFGISLNFYGTPAAVITGFVMMYLPFMIFPIYTVLEKIDPQITAAAQDLGCTPYRTFLKVTLPLSVKGIMSGVIMVFLPVAMGFTIPEILGAGKIQLIGNTIENFFKRANIYNLGSLISLLIIGLVIGSLAIIGRIDSEGETLI